MAAAFVERCAPQIRTLLVARGGHPLPDAESFAAGARALSLADDSRARGETLVVLLSGGASAMLAAPAAGVTLEDKVAATRRLLRSGLPIAAINAERRRLPAIKGGQLGARAGRSITFAISDVHAPIEDDPSVIGSGPTVGDPPLAEARFILAGSRRDAMRGAQSVATRLGYTVIVVDAPLIGEAQEAAAWFAERARAAAAQSAGPVCVIASGETTVTLPRQHGRGGRNQELALAMAARLDGLPDYVFASVGTDGIDGPTDAAGAVVDATTMMRARDQGLDVSAALQGHDAYPLFAALGDLIVTGATGTNVGDLQIFLVRRT
jgi:glycerate 2-kinase